MKIKELLFVSQETISLEQCSSENLKENRPLFAMCCVPGVRWCLSAHELAQWPEMWTHGGTCAAARVAAHPRHTPGTRLLHPEPPLLFHAGLRICTEKAGKSPDAKILPVYLFIYLLISPSYLSVCLSTWLLAGSLVKGFHILELIYNCCVSSFFQRGKSLISRISHCNMWSGSGDRNCRQ